MNEDQAQFIKELKIEAVRNDGQFYVEGEEPEYRLDIWGSIVALGASAIIKLTKEGVELIDKVIDVIAKARKGSFIPIEIKCPDGKTEIKIEGREREIREKLMVLKDLCK